MFSGNELDQEYIHWLQTRHPMEKALLDALVLSLDNDDECKRILYIALPHFVKFHDRALNDAYVSKRI